MKTPSSSPYAPPYMNTGEFPAVSRSPEASVPAREWTAQERRWWDELMARSRDRNLHFEVEAHPGLECD
jgi:hypothetical protein